MTPTTGRPRQTVNIKRRILGAGIIILLIGASLAVLLPSVNSSRSAQLSGGVLIWHSLTDSDAEALTGVLEEFENLHPEIAIHQQSFSTPDELLAQYRLSVQSGLGPDLFLGDSLWVAPLARAGFLRAIDAALPTDDTSQFMPAAVKSVSYKDEIYGLPLSLYVPALYYNTRLVDDPPETLDALITQAADGRTVLMSTDFRDAFWGVQAFGGQFLDEEGRAILDQGGYANWLDWLMTARDAPGMILDGNRESLRERFLRGDAAYYVGLPGEMKTLTDALGEDGLGVAPLPSGPTGSAGPFLGVEALMFSPVSSANQRDISLELAQFLTNPEQSATLMREARLVPANTRVRINPRLHPLMAGFLAQARSAIPVPNTDTADKVWSVATEAYNRVLNGLSTPLEAAEETTAAINEANGFEAANQETPVCTELGTVRLVHDWEDESAAALDEIVQRFKAVCPLVIVNSQYENLDTVRARWKRNPTAATNPDIVLAPQAWLTDALQDGVPLKDISALVPGDTLQRYLPAALSGMRSGTSLLGLPMSVRVHVLYYNRSLVDEPAHVIERLRLQADNGIPIALDARFVPAYWGVGAFGGRLFGDENRVALDEGGFADWLAWLRQSRDEHGIQLAMEPGEAKRMFLDGASAYYVGEPKDLAELASALGSENLGIDILPVGPEGPATPLFVSSGLFFNDRISENDLVAALGFALFATNAENQELLVTATGKIPSNATVDLTAYPNIAAFLEQSKTAYPLPNLPYIRSVLDLGDQAYIDVLVNGVDPEQAAAEVTERMSEASGLDAGEQARAQDSTTPAPPVQTVLSAEPPSSASTTGPQISNEDQESPQGQNRP